MPMMGFFPADLTRSLAVDLGNSVACPGCRGRDAFATTSEAERWIRRKLSIVKATVSPRELRELRRFRGRLRDLLEAASDRTAPSRVSLEAINLAAARSSSPPELHWNLGRWNAESRRKETRAARELTARAARSLIDLLASPSPAPIRRCAGPGCIHFLVARRSSQRWCSPTGCGNRARVQRHYRKLRFRRPSKQVG